MHPPIYCLPGEDGCVPGRHPEGMPEGFRPHGAEFRRQAKDGRPCDVSRCVEIIQCVGCPVELPRRVLRLVDKDGDGKFNSEGETLVWLEGEVLDRPKALEL